MSKQETQGVRIALLETNQINNHNTVMDKIDEILKRFDTFEQKLDMSLEDKADKWVEKAFTWALYSVGGILITAFMYLIINK